MSTQRTWPPSLPQAPQAEQWVMSPQANSISFEPELGDSIDRRRGSAAFEIYEATFAPLTDNQRRDFIEWYRDDLKDGTLPFYWTDPIAGTDHLWKFVKGQQPYQITSGQGFLHTLTCTLLKKG